MRIQQWFLTLVIAVSLFLATSAFAQPWHYNILWQREGRNDSSHYGTSIRPLGDQNNDGYADWAVKIGGGGRAGTPNEDYVEFFHGGNPPTQEPYMTFRANPAIHWDLDSFFPAGDLNGDSFIDWVVVFRPIENFRECLNQVYFGGTNGDTIPVFTIHMSWDIFFHPIGDYNADGFADLWGWDEMADTNWIYYGGNPMDTLPDLRMPEIYRAYGDLNGDHVSDFVDWDGGFYCGGVHPDTLPRYTWSPFEYSGVSIVNDLNGDGNDDMVNEPPTRDRLNIHCGRNNQMSQTPDFIVSFSLGDRSYSVGDINQDGYNDFASKREQDGGLGIFLGHPWFSRDPAFIIGIRTNPFNLAATSWIAGLGDVNGDGINDIGICGTNDDFDGRRGKAFVFSGDTTFHVDTSPSRPELAQEFRVSVYPNPFNSQTTIKLEMPLYSKSANVAVFNVLGQEVFHKEIAAPSSKEMFSLNASSWSSGLYLLHVKTGNLQTTQKLMVLK